MSKKSLQNRRTPRWLFEELNERFGPFILDAFADETNALCPRYLTVREDGCRHPWLDVTFANPRFEWMKGPVYQAMKQAERGIRSIMLGPVGGSQGWYQRWAIRGTIYVPDKRISYDLPEGVPDPGADRDTIVMGFGGEHTNPRWRNGEFRVRALPLDGP